MGSTLAYLYSCIRAGTVGDETESEKERGEEREQKETTIREYWKRRERDAKSTRRGRSGKSKKIR